MGGPKARRRSRPDSDAGPKLPFAIAQEVGRSYAAANAKPGKRGQSIFLVSQRKAARKAARKGKKQRQQQQQQPAWQRAAPGRADHAEQQEGERPKKRQRMAPVPLHHPAAQPAGGDAAAKQRPAAPAKEKPVKTKFRELLGGDAFKSTNARAIEAEDREQRLLAKKLGIRKKGSAAQEEPASLRELMDKDMEMPDSEDDDMLAAGSSSEDEGGSGSDASDGATSLEPSDPDSGAGPAGSSGASVQGSDGDSDASGGGGEESDDAASGSASEGEDPDDSGQPQGKYVPPAARQQAGDRGHAQLRRRVTGLINKLSDANLPQIGDELLGLLDSGGRRRVADAVTELLLEAAAEGPRATDRFAAVAAALIAGLAGRGNAPEVGARFAAALATRLEAALDSADTLAAANLATLLGQLHATGLLPAACLFSALDTLRARFREQDVAVMHLLLRVAGFKLRAEDPAAMKDFVVAVHARAAEAAGAMSQRAEVLLELVLDIKNNRRKGGSGSAAALDALLGQGSLRWLRESRATEAQPRALTWQRLLQPDKKGMWWLPEAGSTTPLLLASTRSGGGSEWGAELLQLAAQQRMNTDVRRAVFCIVMGAEDAADAAERLLRLPLKGEAQREVVRVAVECCLQEAGWNGYYAALLRAVLAANKAHAITAQFCLWDHLKELAQQPPRRVANLARLAAELVVLKALPLSALRAGRPGQAGTEQERQFWTAFLRRLLLAPKDDAGLLALLKPVAQPALASFAAALRTFLATEFDAEAAGEPAAERLLARSKLAQKRLAARQPLMAD